MVKDLLQEINDKKHHCYRRPCTLEFIEEFSAQGLAPIERMTRRFERLMAAEIPVILENEQICYLRTFSNIPGIFSPEEWEKIKNEHYIHELGYMSNLTPN